MPASRRSLQLTETYRSRLRALVDGVDREAKQVWGELSWDDLRGSYEPIAQRVNTSIQRAQTAAVRLTAAYITAYLSTELGKRQRTVSIPSSNYVGTSYGDLPLDEALQKPLISLLVANGKGEPDPMGTGLKALRTNIDLNVKHAGRKALQDVIEADERIVGWRRAVKGTCAACSGLATDAQSPPGTPLEIHPNCECVSEAVVRNVPNRFPRPTGRDLFTALAADKQDELLGPEAAEKVRNGDATLEDFVQHESPGDTPGFITQKPVEDL